MAGALALPSMDKFGRRMEARIARLQQRAMRQPSAEPNALIPAAARRLRPKNNPLAEIRRARLVQMVRSLALFSMDKFGRRMEARIARLQQRAMRQTTAEPNALIPAAARRLRPKNNPLAEIRR